MKKHVILRVIGIALMLYVIIALTFGIKLHLASWLTEGKPLIAYFSGGQVKVTDRTTQIPICVDVYIKQPLTVESCTLTINGVTINLQLTAKFNVTNGAYNGELLHNYNDCFFTGQFTMEQVNAVYDVIYTATYTAVYRDYVDQKTTQFTFTQSTVTNVDTTTPENNVNTIPYLATFSIGALAVMLSIYMEKTESG